MKTGTCIGVIAPTVFLLVSAAARADEKTERLLGEVRAAYQKAQTLVADLVIEEPRNDFRQGARIGTMRLKKPNLARVELSGETVVSNGKTLWHLYTRSNTFERMPADPPRLRSVLPWLLAGVLFYDSAFLDPRSRSAATVRALEPRAIDGASCQVVEIVQKGPRPLQTTLYIGPDRLIRRSVASMGSSFIVDVTLKNVQADRPLAESVFAFRLPETARPLAEVAAEAEDPHGQRSAATSASTTLFFVLGGFIVLNSLWWILRGLRRSHDADEETIG